MKGNKEKHRNASESGGGGEEPERDGAGEARTHGSDRATLGRLSCDPMSASSLAPRFMPPCSTRRARPPPPQPPPGLRARPIPRSTTLRAPPSPPPPPPISPRSVSAAADAGSARHEHPPTLAAPLDAAPGTARRARRGGGS